MRSERDLGLRLRARQLFWLRAVQQQRRTLLERLWARCLRRACQRSLLLPRGARALAVSSTAGVARRGSVTRALSRCQTSGRARNVARLCQLARMHLRGAAAEGFLGQLTFQRP